MLETFSRHEEKALMIDNPASSSYHQIDGFASDYQQQQKKPMPMSGLSRLMPYAAKS